MIEKIKPLKIALIGYNREQTINALKVLCENNKEHVSIFNDRYYNQIIFKDGTIVKAISNENDIRSSRFDQLILCDDSKWQIKVHKRGLIDYVRLNLMSHSCVPEDYQIIKYEI